MKNKTWKQYFEVVCQYWLPINKNNKLFIIYIVLLLCFIISFLFLFLLGFSVIIRYFPQSIYQIFSNFSDKIKSISSTNWKYFIISGLVIPVLIFFILQKKIKSNLVAWGLLGFLLLLSFSVSGLNVIISFVNRYFINSLLDKNISEFWKMFVVFFGVFVIGSPIVALYPWVKQKLGILWRQWLTEDFIQKYFCNLKYYKIEIKKDIDNPDQRLSEDMKHFTMTSLEFLLIVLGAIIDIIAFTGILWFISKSLSFILISYAVMGTFVTIFIGKNLIRLNFQQLKKEADFRYNLVHIRDNSESIAFYSGEKLEKKNLLQNLGNVVKNFNLLIGWQRNLDFFTKYYQYIIVLLPTIILAPKFFRGEIQYGTISQAGMAFSQILSAFSVIVYEFDKLSEFMAGIQRIINFKNRIETEEETKYPKINYKNGKNIEIISVNYYTPDHKQILLKNLNVKISNYDKLLIQGKSGIGKSSLLRIISNLWSSGDGKIIIPERNKILFLSQKPYMFNGTLREQLMYPKLNNQITKEIDEKFICIIEKVNLGNVFIKLFGCSKLSIDCLDEIRDWNNILSLGEQQRLSFARALTYKWDFIIFDEATSSLDVENEENLYKLITDSNIGYISIGHRDSLRKYHNKLLTINNVDNYKITKI